VVSLPPLTVIVAPRPWDGARPGKCYSNVLQTIRRHGGEFCYGWALTDCGPHCLSGRGPAPLYRRWLNHVVWRDAGGQLWEVSPNAVINNHAETRFAPTEFLHDADATFEIVSEETWFTRNARYVALRPEGLPVVQLLNQAQDAQGEARSSLLQQALAALRAGGFQPREWKIESIGERTGSIWLIAE